MDEIGREVVRLRNQQRLVLQERRQVAKDKKARADQRRAVYAAELQRHSQTAAAAEAECREAQERAKEADKQRTVVEKSRALLAEGARASEAEVAKLQGLVAGLSSEVEGTRCQLHEARASHEVAQHAWAQERATLGVEVRKSEMLLDAVQRSVQAGEAKLAQERASLPAHQQRMYEEQLARTAQAEADLRDRAHALSSEEARRLAGLEQLKKDTMDQVNRHRLRAEADMAAERAELLKQRAALDAAAMQWDTTKSYESVAAESQRVDLQRKERDLDEARAQLLQQRTELEASQRMMEPNVRAAERDRADARAIKAQADRVLFSAEEHASAILAAERGLVRREQTVAAAEKGLETARARLTADRRALLAEGAKQRAAQQALDTERFRLHQCSVELAAQLALVKRGINQLARSADRFSLREPLESDAVGPAALVLLDDDLVAEARGPTRPAAPQAHYPAALDPSLIHTAISLQDVGRALKSVAAATAALDPALEMLLAPRSFDREELSFAEMLGAGALSDPAQRHAQTMRDLSPYTSPHAYEPAAERKEEVPAFESLRSEGSKARCSDETAIASVRSSVASSQQATATLKSFASKFGVFLAK